MTPGLRTAGLKAKLEDLEARQIEIEAALSEPPPAPLRLHPGLSEIYRRKVTALAATLADPAIRTPALETIRGLIRSVTVHEEDGRVRVELDGAITALIGLAQPEAAAALDPSSAELVAGVGFEPTTFRL